MSGQSTSQRPIQAYSFMPSVTGILDLFSRSPRSAEQVSASTKRPYAHLWQADAIHRAKNLAQMAVSLADVADHPSRQWLPPEIAAQVRSLARAYDVLGEEGEDSQPVPCAGLLIEIATRLTDIFGKARGISIILEVTQVMVTPAVRRVLVLLCSELIINTLKYAYPSNAGGLIRVFLLSDGSHVRLIVEDDGVGLSSTDAAGQGSGLIEQLCAVAGGALIRKTGTNGCGLRVDITVRAE